MPPEGMDSKECTRFLARAHVTISRRSLPLEGVSLALPSTNAGPFGY